MILLLTNASVGEIMVVTGLWLLNLRRGCTLTVYHGLVRVSSAKVFTRLGVSWLVYFVKGWSFTRLGGYANAWV